MRFRNAEGGQHVCGGCAGAGGTVVLFVSSFYPFWRHGKQEAGRKPRKGNLPNLSRYVQRIKVVYELRIRVTIHVFCTW